MNRVNNLRSLTILATITALSQFPASAQEIDWDAAVQQVQENEAREAAKRAELRDKLRLEMEKTKHEYRGLFSDEVYRHTASQTLANAPTLAEFMRNPENAARVRQDPKPRILWPYGATAAAAALLWATWRRRRRIIGMVEDMIVFVGAGLIRTGRTVHTNFARIRRRVIDRAG